MASLVTINSMQTRGGDGNEQDAPELLSKLPPVNIRVEDLKLGILFDRSAYLLILVLGIDHCPSVLQHLAITKSGVHKRRGRIRSNR